MLGSFHDIYLLLALLCFLHHLVVDLLVLQVTSICLHQHILLFCNLGQVRIFPADLLIFLHQIPIPSVQLLNCLLILVVLFVVVEDVMLQHLHHLVLVILLGLPHLHQSAVQFLHRHHMRVLLSFLRFYVIEDLGH